MPACTHCPSPAVLWQRYSGEHLCAAHLERSVERRVTRELARDKLHRGDLVLCAVSGGKDSIAALRLAHRYLGPAGIRVEALTVDEGIAGYRPEGVAVAARACAALGVAHEVVRVRDVFGASMDEVSASLAQPRRRAGPGGALPMARPAGAGNAGAGSGDAGSAGAGRGGGAPCSPCGVFRRSVMNRMARERGAARLVTGHNLDDLAQSVLMNVLRGDAARLARLGRHGDGLPGLVPRLLPLRAVPEREVALYARLQGWEVHVEECPYSALAHRRGVRDTLLALEDSDPGTRHALAALLDKVAPALQASGHFAAELRACPDCGEPTSGARCQACAVLARIRPAGPWSVPAPAAATDPR